jgi:hypothetical protein
MTKKNLVASILAAAMSVTLLTAAREPVSAQFQAKSVTQEAAQSVTKPSTKVASRNQANVSRSIKRTTKTYVVKTTHKPQVKPSNLVRNVRGVQASAWRGKNYNPRWENVRKCIVFRESRGNYSVHRKGNKAGGAYQFLPNWTRGLAYMIGKPQLKQVPIWKWSQQDQDHGFWAAWNNGKGSKHWRGGNIRCF